jgi:hypothetical protein
MKGRPKIPQKVIDQVLVESRHRCNVCKKEVALIHHIDKIRSEEGNLPSNLVVLCTECHRRAELPNSHFEHKITSSQLKKYKKEWTEACKAFPTIAFEQPVLVYCFLNEPRIGMMFNQLAKPIDTVKVIELKQRVLESRMSGFENIPLERMMQTIIDRWSFINLETICIKETLPYLEKLEGFPVCGTTSFYSRGLKSPQFYEKHGIKEMPYIYNNRKIGNKTLKVTISYDPKYIISTTAYVELSGHHRLSFYGIMKRVKNNIDIVTLEILPLSIGLKQPLNPINTHFRLFY